MWFHSHDVSKSPAGSGQCNHAMTRIHPKHGQGQQTTASHLRGLAWGITYQGTLRPPPSQRSGRVWQWPSLRVLCPNDHFGSGHSALRQGPSSGRGGVFFL